MTEGFDAAAREAELRDEAEQWDVSAPRPAAPGEIPVIDVAEYLATDDPAAGAHAASQLRAACENIGFHQLTGHGITATDFDSIFAATRELHALSPTTKAAFELDRPGWPVGGVGYLPIGERKLPRRTYGNRNAAFLVKRDVGLEFDDNQWPPDTELPGFRLSVEHYATQIESLARRLVPLYALALDLDPTFFADAFDEPFWRLRLSQYPAGEQLGGGRFGIAPHVDTTFFTLLAQDGPGLTVHHAPSGDWIRVPVVTDALVVNTGELLRQWSNDRFLSTRHFADNHAGTERHSIPFFFNANADHVMTCLPTCTGADNPPRYAPTSYRTSQAAVQNE